MYNVKLLYFFTYLYKFMLELSSFDKSYILEIVKSVLKTKNKLIYYMQKLSFHGIP